MDWWNEPRQIQILVDNDSWILPWARRLAERINQTQDSCTLRRAATKLTTGDIVFLLGCTRLVEPRILALNRHNLVVHESDLPRGRGFAPMTWQVLEGARIIPVCLLEASDEPDAGEVYQRREIRLAGHELCDELRQLQGQATIDICMDWLNSNRIPNGVPQLGEASVYPRRDPHDSRLDPDKTLAEQFELLRVCDNQRYPAWLEHRGRRYEIRISLTDETGTPTDAAKQESVAAAEDPSVYVVAGCKSWNRSCFDQATKLLPGTWHYIGSPEELTSGRLESLDPKMIFFLHWSWRVPDDIWQQYACVCFHMTDVPYGRGGSPLQNLIVRGHRQTTLSALQMTHEMDAGPVYLKRPLELDGTAAEILERASRLSLEMIGQIIEQPIQPVQQTGQVVSFQRRTPEQSRIAAPDDLCQLYDHIRMLDGEGYPAAWLESGGCRYEFTGARLSADGQSLSAEVTIRPSNATARKAS